MKKTILILFLLTGLVFAQGFSNPANPAGSVLPFIAGNDTLFHQDSLYSRPLFLSKFVGAISVGFQFKAVGDSCKAIDIYYQGRINDLNWGVPYDSLSVTYQDSNAYQQIHIAIVDSTTIKDQDAFWIPLSNLSWWGYHDEGRFIIKSPATVDTIYVKCRVRGQ